MWLKYGLTFKVHIPNKSVLSSQRVLYSVDAHINDSCSFFNHIRSDKVGNTFKKTWKSEPFALEKNVGNCETMSKKI